MAYPGPSVIPQWISAPATGIASAGPSAPYLRQTDANGYTRFRSPSSIGSGRTAMSGRMTVLLPANAGNTNTINLFTIGNNAVLKTRQGGSQAGELLFEIGHAFQEFHAQIVLPAGTLTLDAPVALEWGTKLSTTVADREGWLRVGGTLYTDEDQADAVTTSGQFQSGQFLDFLPTQQPGQFSNIDWWWSYNALGVLPAGAPDVAIGPDLAGVNAHPHRIGAPAVAA